VVVPELEHALDELYGVELSHFAQTRKRLASELKTVGHDDAAAVVTACRKPTAAA